MNPEQQAASGDKSDEISELIATLHKSMRRLELLTDGAVGTVADRRGRTIVLQLAEKQLRQGEVARQAAILNALPAHIALLDYHGIVVSVNDAWRRFADDNIFPGTEQGIGLNYIAVCESARGADAADALQAAAGIRKVLHGTATSFALEYPCHSPTQQRWFLMTVTPLHDGRRTGVVVMHLDISERRRVEHALKALTQKTERRERILNTTLACISDFAYVYDRDGRFLFANQTLLDLWGITLEEAVGKNFLDLGYPEDTATQLAHDVQQVFDTKRSVTGELPYTSPSGVFGVYEYIFSPVTNDDGSVDLVVGSSRDVTARRSAIAAIRISEQEQRQLAEQLEVERSRLVAAQRVAKVGNWEIDLITMSVIWSEEMHRIYETDAATFHPTYQCFLELVHPADREAVEEAFRQPFGSANPFVVEHRLSFPDGCNKVVEQRWRVIHGENENPIRAVGTCQDITERKEAEAARQRLAAILESTPDLVGISDPAGKILYLNHAGRDVLGFGQQDDLSQIAIADFLSDPLHHSFLTTGIPTAVRNGNWRGEALLRSRSGLEIPVSQLILAHKSSDGKLEYISTIMRDITERIKAETAARASDAEFRNLTESMPQIVWITGADGACTYLNQKWMVYTGLGLEESLGDGWTQPFHPDDREMAWESWQQAVASSGAYTIESRLRRADGMYRWWLIRGVPQIDVTGKTLKWIGTCTDIHDMKEAELKISSTNASLRESERRFSDMLGHVALATVMLDLEARITFCNEFLLGLTGWQLEDVIGKNWFELFVPADFQHTREIFDTNIRTEPKSWHHENQILTRSGERLLMRWSVSILRTGAGEVAGMASIGEDITERKAAERTILRLNRVYAVLSGINTLIVRAQDRNELFSETCRIAVEAGGFRMAMIAVVASGTMELVPVASAGKDEALLQAIKTILASPDMAPKTMSARAMREKQAVVSNDSLHDPQVVFGPAYAKAGVRAQAVLPLWGGNETVGVLVFYSSEPGFFQEEELKLLTELAGDIGLAMDHLDKQERLSYLAHFDALTGLANRTLLLERVEQYKRNAASGGHQLGLFLVDLERFKNINDSLGRHVGDDLLRQVAQWLTRHTRGDAKLLARIGADHFAVVMPVIQARSNVVDLLEQWTDAFLKHPFRLNDGVFRISLKVGVALFPDDGVTADSLFKHAEAALKKAKTSGERYLFYTHAMTEAGPANLTMENQLRQAIDNEEFVLYYQPKVNLVSGKMTSAEALIRWNDPRTGLVPPARFIPILEETGLIHDVGRWALRRAIQDYLRWRAAGLPVVRIAVNVSPLQLRDRSFIAELKQVTSLDENAAAGLELEITESLIMENVQHSIASLRAIRDLGISIAIDDFGTGFSSLSYLSKFPVDTVKIDRAFVIEMTDSKQGLALVSTIISLAHALQLKVVAEGVETEEQARLLRVLNCDEMQGYLFSKPVPGAVFETRFLGSLDRPGAV